MVLRDPSSKPSGGKRNIRNSDLIRSVDITASKDSHSPTLTQINVQMDQGLKMNYNCELKL